MKLHFPWRAVAAAIDTVRRAGQHSTLHGETVGPGLLLVGDQGVYLMPNNIDGPRPVIYADECNPTQLDFDTWWSAKRASFGPDDGAEHISLEKLDDVIAMSGHGFEPQWFVVDFGAGEFSIGLACRRAS